MAAAMRGIVRLNWNMSTTRRLPTKVRRSARAHTTAITMARAVETSATLNVNSSESMK